MAEYAFRACRRGNMTCRLVGDMTIVASRGNADVIKRRAREGEGGGMTRFAILIGLGDGVSGRFAESA